VREIRVAWPVQFASVMARRLVVSTAWLLVVAAAGCGRSRGALPETRPAPLGPERVVVGVYTLHVYPRQGRVDLRPAHAGRGSYDYSGGPFKWETCVPPACSVADGMIALGTDQSKVTYHGHDDVCTSNGNVIDCADIPSPACNQKGRFCAPLQLVSGVTFGNPRGALADVVVQLAQEDNQKNAVLGCATDGANSFGVCRGEKVDHANSNLISPIPGTPNGLVACSYCYGNAAQANQMGLPGLEHAVVSGTADFLQLIDTDTVGLGLDTDEDMSITITVLQAIPTFARPGEQLVLSDKDGPATCVKPGTTTLTVRGGGFGPPGECLQDFPPSQCPLSGHAGPGYALQVDTLTGPKTVVPTSWSDVEITATLPADMVDSRVTVIAPHGPPATSADTLTLCPGFTRRPMIISGAGTIDGVGGLRLTVEVGHGLRRQGASGGGIEMQMETTVEP
jgi:hypothetical protein